MRQDNSWAGKSVIEDIREAATIAAFEHCLEEWNEQIGSTVMVQALTDECAEE